MYLNEIYLENTGPISKCHVQMPFADDGNPRPVVIVGPNGSGKSIFLSYIVDALFELAKIAFRDIVPSDGLIKPYYRVVSNSSIKSGASHSLSLLQFQSVDSELHYCEKSGHLDPNTPHLDDFNSKFQRVWNWNPVGNHKLVSSGETFEKIVRDDMEKGAHVFFPSSRHESPGWLNQVSQIPHSVNATQRRVRGILGKPIQVETCTEETVKWVMDLYIDLVVANVIPNPSTGNALDEFHSITSVCEILRDILQDHEAKIHFGRRNAPSRLSIHLSDGSRIPNFQYLSDGQSQLLNMFATIIRYAEHRNMDKSVHLSQITGLVLIDEIESHSHTTLQYEIVPKLIKRFPKVQFIVTSHSPLFLLGMENEFGPDGLRFLELPAGTRISAEKYTEFANAFNYYLQTDAFHDQIEQRVKDGTKPLVLTEGPLDVRYIQAALEVFGKRHLLDSIDIQFVGIETNEGTKNSGAGALNKVAGFYKGNPSLLHRPIMLLYDCDRTQDSKKHDQRGNRLWLRTIPPNSEKTTVSKGIENLFPQALFAEQFYPEKPSPKGDGGTVRELDKTAFCNWICEEGKKREHFEEFDAVIQILEEFSAAHPSNKPGT